MPNASPTTADPPPAKLLEALNREIDPSETVRWYGRPGEQHYATASMMYAGIFMVLSGFLGIGMILLGIMSLIEYLTGEPRQPGGAPTTAGDVIGFATALVGCIAVFIASPAIAYRWGKRESRRIIYGLTNTRLLSLRLSDKGLAQITSLEPAHPLDITRDEHKDGRGTLKVQRVGASALLTLTGIESPREVDLLIRETFDPPPGSTSSQGVGL